MILTNAVKTNVVIDCLKMAYSRHPKKHCRSIWAKSYTLGITSFIARNLQLITFALHSLPTSPPHSPTGHFNYEDLIVALKNFFMIMPF